MNLERNTIFLKAKKNMQLVLCTDAFLHCFFGVTWLMQQISEPQIDFLSSLHNLYIDVVLVNILNTPHVTSCESKISFWDKKQNGQLIPIQSYLKSLNSQKATFYILSFIRGHLFHMVFKWTTGSFKCPLLKSFWVLGPSKYLIQGALAESEHVMVSVICHHHICWLKLHNLLISFFWQILLGTSNGNWEN